MIAALGWLACIDTGTPTDAATHASPTAPTADSGEPFEPYNPYEDGLVGDVARGGDRFMVRCASCHGAEGRGGLGPDLRIRAPRFDDFELYLVITEGREAMPMINVDDPQEAVDIVAWLRKTFGPPTR